MIKLIKGLMALTFVCFWGCNGDYDKDVVPEAVVLVSPIDDEVCELGVSYGRNTSRLMFEWELTRNAQLYDLVVTNLETGENYITYRDISNNFKELVLDNEVSYSWQVIARNVNTEQVGISDLWEFFFVGEPRSNQAPLPANILSPNSSEYVKATDGQVTLSWQGIDPDGDPMSYTIFFDTIDGTQPTINELKNLNQTDVDVQVKSGETYYWRVLSDDGVGITFSPVYSFTVN